MRLAWHVAEEAFDFKHEAGDARPDSGYWHDRSSRNAASRPLHKDRLTKMANDKTPCWLSVEAGKGPGGSYNLVHKNK